VSRQAQSPGGERDHGEDARAELRENDITQRDVGGGRESSPESEANPPRSYKLGERVFFPWMCLPRRRARWLCN